MKRILYCVLNWGIGHATRSSPLISDLLEKGSEVEIASDGLALAYLKKSFPNLNFHVLPAYDVTYPTSSLHANMVVSLNKIRKAIKLEEQQIKRLVEDRGIDILISDNRYGCFHPSIPCILISHQLRLLSPNKISQSIAEIYLTNKLRPFDELWVPDNPPPHNLTGKMSDLVDDRIKFIGPLTSLVKTEFTSEANRLLFLLSGPEPARTKFEQKLISLKIHDSMDCILIRGAVNNSIEYPKEIEVIHLASAREVSKAICRANIIVCRSGYSTIMDLQFMNKNAIYIPTPGQPEQTYLADVIVQKKKGIKIDEKDLTVTSLESAIKKFHDLPSHVNNPTLIYQNHIIRILEC